MSSDFSKWTYELKDLYQPMPELPIELVGGHSDGRQVNLPNLPFIQVPLPPETPKFITAEEALYPTSVELKVDLYAQGEISDKSHCWRYHFVGTR